MFGCDFCSQRLHGRGDVDLRRVNGGAGDECIGPSRDHLSSVANLDAAVHLETAGWVHRVEQVPHAPDTLEGGRYKGLAAKPRIDRHDQDLAHDGEDWLQHHHWCAGVEGDAGRGTRFFNRPQCAVKIRVHLDVDGDRIGTGGGEPIDPAGWLDDHEVDVDREIGCGAHGLDDREPDADIGYEDAVHDVNVDEVRTGRFDRGDLLAEPAKVSRQD